MLSAQHRALCRPLAEPARRRAIWHSMRLHPMSSAKSVAERNAEAERVSSVMRAASHPVRVTALAAFSKGELSPIELSRVLGDTEWALGVIAYHVRVLAATGLIELSSTIQRRGAIEHVYALTPQGRALADAVDSLTSAPLVPSR